MTFLKNTLMSTAILAALSTTVAAIENTEEEDRASRPIRQQVLEKTAGPEDTPVNFMMGPLWWL